MEIAIALGMVVFAILLLSNDRIPIEVSSLAIVVALVLTGLVTPQEALSGFSSDTAIFIFALLALTQGLGATGVMQIVGRRLLFFARFSRGAFVLMMLGTVGLFSSVASNTAVTAAFLPVATATAAQSRIPANRLLMPMAFASMLGGTIFLFGTSTNLVSSAAMEGLGLRPIGFAELTPAGLPIAIVGILVTVLLMKFLMRSPADRGEVHSLNGQRTYVTEALLAPNSRLIGKPLAAVTGGLGIPVRGVVRDGRLIVTDPAQLVLQERDHLIVTGTLEDILRVKDQRSVGLQADLKIPAPEERQPHALVEVSVPPTSVLAGRSLQEVRFAERYGVAVLAIDRHPTLQLLQPHLSLVRTLSERESLKNVPLSVGDLLLLSGPESRLQALSGSSNLTVLGEVEYQPPRYRRALLALLIFAISVVVAGTRVISPAIAGLAGMLAMIVTGCVDTRTAFRVDWRVPIMIGALLTLGLAMEKSGAGEFLAQGIIPLAHLTGPRGVLGALMLLTIILSIPMSNQAAALIMLPVGVHAAMELGVDPRPFAIGTCLAASCAFLTPLEPSAALVYGPGRYRFVDYLRVGTPLTLMMLGMLLVLVPMIWPF